MNVPLVHEAVAFTLTAFGETDVAMWALSIVSSQFTRLKFEPLKRKLFRVAAKDALFNLRKTELQRLPNK